MNADGFHVFQTVRVTCCEPIPNHESMDWINRMRSGQWYLRSCVQDALLPEDGE